MKIVTDESSMNLGALLGTLRSVAPDVWESRDLSGILPQRMGDLENPEFLDGMKEKIQRLDELKQMLERGSVSQQEYGSLKDEILSR